MLDIGCNAGFYAIEMKRRGADRVLGLDSDDEYLAQARFAAEVSGLDIEFRRLSVYDVGRLGETFDLVIFMGVLYHLRHPLLALDLIHEHVARDLLLFQSMQRGDAVSIRSTRNYDFWTAEQFDRPDIRSCISSSTAMPMTRPTGGCRTAPASKRCCAAPASASRPIRRKKSISAADRASADRWARLSVARQRAMIEAAMIWNEPNNKSHWDPRARSGLGDVRRNGDRAGKAIRAVHPTLPRVLGGISPIDPPSSPT